MAHEELLERADPLDQAEAEYTAPDAVTQAARAVASTMRVGCDRDLHHDRLDRAPGGGRAPGPPDPGPDHRVRHRAPPVAALGLHAVVCADAQNVAEMVDFACRHAVESGIAAAGSSPVITAGVPFGTPGSTNLLRIAWLR